MNRPKIKSFVYFHEILHRVVGYGPSGAIYLKIAKRQQNLSPEMSHYLTCHIKHDCWAHATAYMKDFGKTFCKEEEAL